MHNWHYAHMSQFTVFENVEIIHLPVARVWELLTDWGSANLWMPQVTYMEATEDPPRVGTVLDYQSTKLTRQFIIHQLVEHTALVLHTADDSDSLSYRFDLSPKGADTQVILQVTIIDPDLSVSDCEQLAAQVRAVDAPMLSQLKSYAQLAP